MGYICNSKLRCKLLSTLSSSCCAASTDLPDPLLPLVSIIHCFQKILQATSCIGTELSNLCLSMWRGPQEYIAYEFILTSSAASHMSGSSNLDDFCDGWKVAVQLLFCGVLPLGFFQYSLQHSCVIAVKLFLHTFS